MTDTEAVRQFVIEARSSRPAGLARARRRAEDGIAKAARRATYDAWNTGAVRPVLVALASAPDPFSVDSVRCFDIPLDPSAGAMGAAFSSARQEGLIVPAPDIDHERSSTPSAHGRRVGLWVGVGAAVSEACVPSEAGA